MTGFLAAHDQKKMQMPGICTFLVSIADALCTLYLLSGVDFMDSASFTASYALMTPPVMLKLSSVTSLAVPGCVTFSEANLRVDWSMMVFTWLAVRSGK